MLALKRCIKYLALAMEWVLELRPVRGDLDLYGHCDADWAGLDDRKSVSCGICYLNGSCFLSYSRTQASRALSYCESELYSLGSVVPELLWVSGLLREVFGETTTPTAFSDSSSALTARSSRSAERLTKYIRLGPPPRLRHPRAHRRVQRRGRWRAQSTRSPSSSRSRSTDDENSGVSSDSSSRPSEAQLTWHWPT